MVESSFRTIRAAKMAYEEVDIDPVELSPYTEQEMWERLRSLGRREPPAKTAGDVAARL